ncbi:ABC transporter ATP-binding protein [Spiroplasma culicicola]|uniref:ABC transporter ATP-binding protein n=1 Tax=Spiroplasma culicicola AES-1 TaxID=1276246 RepID=W6A754_9MOLU|nr:ABC transporter ATP-binding protein [Spiroplasma culicicola]AHI52822.1 ABC transporter ATP-binding protein [Spiroplasma culicicola AES-1]
MICLNGINKKIKNKNILEDVTFTIKENEITAFVGDNGAGKTTTIKAIFGEVKIDSGTIIFEDIDKNKDVAFFPDSNNLSLNITLYEYLYYLSKLYKIESELISSKIIEILELLALKEYSKNIIKTLSAGQKKRIILAGIILQKPKVIIFDEPTSNLDVQGRVELLSLIKKMNEELKITIMITSHIIDELDEIAQNLIIITSGKIVYDSKLKENEKIIDIYSKYANKKVIDSNELIKKMKGDY